MREVYDVRVFLNNGDGSGTYEQPFLGPFPVGVIGPKADLTYPYEYLGAGPETLADIGKHSFAESLRKAKAPMLIARPKAAVNARIRRTARLISSSGH